jgi:catechol 2,3-dioxygenase
MRMGAVELTVADLGRSLAYYEHEIGLSVQSRVNGTATLGAGGEPLLVLTEQAGARPGEGFSGLFVHAGANRVQLTGLSDHAVSEALYLRDPDHHGIELYADRPRELWEGRVGELMTSIPLDTADLLREAGDDAFTGLPAGTTMGHVHLSVADVEASVEFYRGLGFDVMALLGGDAAFLATGGYHHHIGVNSWQSRGAPYAPEDRARLTRVTVLGAPEPLDLRDPSGIPVALSTDR